MAFYVERNNPSGGKIYVDGKCVKTFNPTAREESLNNEQDLLIGKHCVWDDKRFEGILDELWIFRGK